MRVIAVLLIRSLVVLGLAALILGLGACGEEKKPAAEISTLEKRYQDLLDQSGSEAQLDKVWAAMKELAAAYEGRSQDSKDDESAVNDLYRAAELYGGALEYNKALGIFDQIVARYPSHKRAADALFQKGFIFNNRLNDTTQARIAYTEFIEKYPNDPLADDAQIEIDRLGIPTEEWLERFIKKDSANNETSE
jgi:tetratricopeptide (TPR) repeat protein